MRMMMKVSIPIEAGNKAIKEGSLPQIVGKFVETYKPEAAYFVAETGQRMAIFVLDISDSQDLPSLAEPFFLGLNADVHFSICMNFDDMKAGVEKASKHL